MTLPFPPPRRVHNNNPTHSRQDSETVGHSARMSHVDDYPSRSPAGPSRASASPSNPFANLHTDLHGPNAGQAPSRPGEGTSGGGGAAGGSSTGAGHSGRSMSPNRLTDFAQHVLGVNPINPEEIIQVMNGSHAGDPHGRAHGHHSHHDDEEDDHVPDDGRNRHGAGGGHDLHGGEDTRGDAENLLAFTGTQESFLPGGQGFEGLMSEAAGLDLGRQHLDGTDGRDDVGDAGGMMMGDDDGRNPEMQGQHDQHPPHTPHHQQQQRRGKRRRDVDTIDGVELDPIRMKKDSHVRSAKSGRWGAGR